MSHPSIDMYADPPSRPPPSPQASPRPGAGQRPLSSQPVYSVPHANANSWQGLSSAEIQTTSGGVQRFQATFLTRPFGFECDSTLRVVAVTDESAAQRANIPVGSIVETIGGQGARFSDLNTCPLPAVITFSFNPKDARNQQLQASAADSPSPGKQQPMPRVGDIRVVPNGQAKRPSTAESALNAVRRAVDMDLQMNPNPLQEEIRMHAVYFTIISAFLFSMFICAVVGIATDMTVTPVDGGQGDELRWSQNGLRVCTAGDCVSIEELDFATLCNTQFVEVVSNGDCARIWDSARGSRTAGGFAIFFILSAALIMGGIVYRYLKGSATLLVIPHQFFALIMGVLWIILLSVFAVWSSQVHATITGDLVFVGELGLPEPQFAASRFAAGFAAWVAAWLCCTVIIVAEFCQWWRQKEPVNSPDWLECVWLPLPGVPRSMSAKQ